MKPPWTKHSQVEYKRLAGKESAPAYLRVVWYAMGNHKANGHCELGRSQLATFLGNGKGPYRYVAQAIAAAVELELLDPSSHARCLVVPSALIEGPQGDGDETCYTHKSTRPVGSRAKCHPDRPHHARGLCNSCYRRDARVQKLRDSLLEQSSEITGQPE